MPDNTEHVTEANCVLCRDLDLTQRSANARRPHRDLSPRDRAYLRWLHGSLHREPLRELPKDRGEEAAEAGGDGTSRKRMKAR